MQLTRFTDYALRVLVYLGAHPDRLSTIAEVASGYGISANHLMKVVNHLAASGYIETVRGKKGGMRLAREPRLINIGEVVRDCEDNFDIVECFNSSRRDCPLLPACTLRSVLSEARNGFFKILDQYNLQDMLGRNPAALFAGRRSVPVPVRVVTE